MDSRRGLIRTTFLAPLTLGLLFLSSCSLFGPRGSSSDSIAANTLETELSAGQTFRTATGGIYVLQSGDLIFPNLQPVTLPAPASNSTSADYFLSPGDTVVASQEESVYRLVGNDSGEGGDIIIDTGRVDENVAMVSLLRGERFITVKGGRYTLNVGDQIIPETGQVTFVPGSSRHNRNIWLSANDVIVAGRSRTDDRADFCIPKGDSFIIRSAAAHFIGENDRIIRASGDIEVADQLPASLLPGDRVVAADENCYADIPTAEIVSPSGGSFSTQGANRRRLAGIVITNTAPLSVSTHGGFYLAVGDGVISVNGGTYLLKGGDQVRDPVSSDSDDPPAPPSLTTEPEPLIIEPPAYILSFSSRCEQTTTGTNSLGGVSYANSSVECGGVWQATRTLQGAYVECELTLERQIAGSDTSIIRERAYLNGLSGFTMPGTDYQWTFSTIRTESRMLSHICQLYASAAA